jgi:hypothetical protein
VLIGALVGVVLVVGLLLSLRASLGSWGAEDALHDVGRGDPAHLEALSKQLAAAAPRFIALCALLSLCHP